MTKDFNWPDAAVETLKRMAAAGDSATQIAAALGHGVTRNSVIGKCTRLKIQLGSGRTLQGAGSRNLEARLHARREDSQKAAKQPKPPRAPRAAAPRVPPRIRIASAGSLTALTHATPFQAQQRVEDYLATPTRRHAFDPEHAPDGARLVKLLDLNSGDCKWPLYEDGPMLFCGCRVTSYDRNGQPNPYCETHLALSLPRALS